MRTKHNNRMCAHEFGGIGQIFLAQLDLHHHYTRNQTTPPRLVIMILFFKSSQALRKPKRKQTETSMKYEHLKRAE